MANIWITTGPITCDVVSTGNITLSGLQTIDSVAVTAGMVVLAAGQSSAPARGPYIVRAGAWDRITSLVTGQQFYIASGTTNATSLYELQTAQPITIGTTALTFGKISGGAAQAGSFTTVDATGTGTFANVTVNNSGVAVPSATNLCTSLSGKGLGIVCGNGNTVGVLNTAASGTSAASLDVFTLSLANNATFDYAPGLGGSMLVSVPGATSCPMAHVGFAANGATTLNGVTPAGGISLTLDNATTLNIYASGGNVRFQNKVGSTISVLVSATKFINA